NSFQPPGCGSDGRIRVGKQSAKNFLKDQARESERGDEGKEIEKDHLGQGLWIANGAVQAQTLIEFPKKQSDDEGGSWNGNGSAKTMRDGEAMKAATRAVCVAVLN